MTSSIVEEELAKVSIFKDESKLSLDYVPALLPHREEALRTLTGFFRSLVESPGKTSQKVIIRGSIGTGKTVLSKRFGEDLEKVAKKKGINFKYIHVNCREEGSFFNILKNIIIKNYESAFPHRGYSSQELLNTFMKILDNNKTYALIALDELEALIRKEGADPLFSLTRINENRPSKAPQRLALLCVFREPECREILDLLDKSTTGTLGYNTLILEKYTATQLEEILNLRVKESFRENTVLPETVELISDLAGGYGDARFAIELLWLAGKHADSEHLSKLLPEHIRTAQMQAHPSLRVEDLRILKLHEKLLLAAIARHLRSNESAYSIFGDIESEYKSLCEEYREKSLAHTQLWKYIKSLSVTGLISTKISGKGQRGKTTLIGLYVSGDKLEKELTKMLEVKRNARR
ncbi:MAG: ORC1-type DNA replication protein [Candidatus Bathyarchaeia archaeon]